MKFIASLAAIAALAVAGSAAAAPSLNGVYVEGNIGSTFQANRDNGTAFGVAVGKQFGPLRGEVEYLGTRGNDSKKLGDTASNLLNANVFVDSPKKVLGVTPFAGVGVGYGNLYHGGVVGGAQNGAVFNGTVGVTYDVNPKLAIVTEYRGFLANSVDFRKAAGQTGNYAVGTATVGVRYTF